MSHIAEPAGSSQRRRILGAPANYLACNGQTVNIADYPELANYFYQQFGSKNKFGGDGTTTFGIPGLRGEFLRGTGTNSHTKQGNGSSVGTHQDATELPIFAQQNTTGTMYSQVASTSWEQQTQKADSTIKPSGGGSSLVWNGSSAKIKEITTVNCVETTRPTNTSVLYCIATKNIYMNPSLDYSTDEKVVGTWIDGKTIYQKCIEIPETIPTANTTLSIILTAPANVDKYVYLGGWMITGEAAYNSIPFSYEDTWFARLCGIETSSRHEILFNCRTTNTNAIRGVAIVQYTKTTS